MTGKANHETSAEKEEEETAEGRGSAGGLEV